MKWVRVEGMKLKPNRCVACGSTGEMSEEGPPEAYFAEGVDVNWGDSVYLCSTCVRILGELRGMMDVDKVKKVEALNTKIDKELKALHAEHNALLQKVERMLDGARARKEAKQVVTK